jgi:hypothetical protein
MEMLHYDGDIHVLTKWAVNRIDTDEVPPEPFRSWIKQFFKPAKLLGYHVGVITPDSPDSADGEWCRGYPHAHYISVGWPKDTPTVITYLAAADSGGQFGLGGLSPDDPYEFIDVKPGLALLIDGATWHGARPVHAGTRISLMTCGEPIPL